MSKRTKSKVFWSGGSQAVRLPKDMRLATSDVEIERRGEGLLVIPIADSDDWAGFWEELLPLSKPLKRWKAGRAEKRAAL